jgi:hypothetical protein
MMESNFQIIRMHDEVGEKNLPGLAALNVEYILS